MNTYEMSEEFASAMVTVIPIILLLGWAEATKLSNVFVAAKAPAVDREVRAALVRIANDGTESPDRGDSPQEPVRQVPFARSLEVVLGLTWGVLAVLHVWAEVSLIRWLATTERPPSPDLAERVTEIAGAGFVMLLIGAFAPVFLIPYMTFALRLVSRSKFARWWMRRIIADDGQAWVNRTMRQGEAVAVPEGSADISRDDASEDSSVPPSR